jgi:hypothetical protein
MPQALCCFSYFSDRVSCFLPGLVLDCIPPTYTSHITGIIGECCHAQKQIFSSLDYLCYFYFSVPYSGNCHHYDLGKIGWLLSLLLETVEIYHVLRVPSVLLPLFHSNPGTGGILNSFTEEKSLSRKWMWPSWYRKSGMIQSGVENQACSKSHIFNHYSMCCFATQRRQEHS